MDWILTTERLPEKNGRYGILRMCTDLDGKSFLHIDVVYYTTKETYEEHLYFEPDDSKESDEIIEFTRFNEIGFWDTYYDSEWGEEQSWKPENIVAWIEFPPYDKIKEAHNG